MLIKEILKKYKGNKHVYYNLDNKSIENYKKLYKFLKNKQNEEVPILAQIMIKRIDKNICIGYTYNYTVMKLIATNL